MTDYTVEKGVSLPKGTPGVTKYPFAGMVKGDSFFVPASAAKNLKVAIHHAARRTGYKVTIRDAEKDGIQGVRVWMVCRRKPKL